MTEDEDHSTRLRMTETPEVERGLGEPIVSVIIPVRNRVEVVVAAIRSCLDEEGVPLEVIVVDDGSTDGTAAGVTAIDDPRVRLIRQPARGVTAARNRAASEARGEWLLPLDSDDELVPGGLSGLLAGARTDVDVVTGALERVDARSSDPIGPIPLGPEFGGVTANFLAGAMLISTAAWRDVGGQLEDLPFGENTELGMRLAARARCLGRRIVATEIITARYVQPPAQRHDHTARAAATVTILRTDRALVERSRAALATSWAIAAVQYARGGRPADAMRCQWSAARSEPGRLRHHVRLLALCVPPLRRRWYRRLVSDEDGVGSGRTVDPPDEQAPFSRLETAPHGGNGGGRTTTGARGPSPGRAADGRGRSSG